MAASTSTGPRPTVHPGMSRIAFYGKCGSAKDAPSSLLRQLRAVMLALPDHTPIAACFADIGIWNRPRNDAPRILSLAGQHVSGGLTELLSQAHARVRTFDVVACFNDSRLPRRIAERKAVLRELAKCGVSVAILTATEPGDFPSSDTAQSRPWALGLLDWTADGVMPPIGHVAAKPSRVDDAWGVAR